ncbi:2-C-methyl-D-erythritol 4-phosphate cytidylyltransferase [Thermocatellispora tengchongensis]|uniref:2-C-methyl-D-erythritol 4-phosphate cytidylyltransferase n=1 Tax=Thermocatellispora tengchongensis TaxID=1073253 RepID=A0A840PFF2_9ACTN|nr:SDR family NAD(P)-dependent oxidoreductase [Thermocatellispora tengchongensis]MBB5134765.1 2-C-methyl-D-erythritol 4-phosphate cytidylyltransferase [Thermocatellispora tengchongensis]
MATPESSRRTVAVILAGGVGRRIGHGTPKQLLQIAGRAMLEHTIAVFEDAPEIDEIMVLMAPGYTGEVAELAARRGFKKVGRVLEGGATRPETTWRALRALEGEERCDVMLHDAARPLVSRSIIARCAEALREHVAVEVAIPTSDTLLVAASGPQGGEYVREVPDRSMYRRAQTPQCFRLELISRAYERAFADPAFLERPATDDVGVVLRYLPEVPIFLVPGGEHNLKVTHPADMAVAETLLRLAEAEVPATTAAARRAALGGRTMVVFGGHHGAGADLARLAAGYGATVRCFSRTRNAVRVEDPVAVADALAQAAGETGRIDYVVNAARLQHMGRLAEAADATVAEAAGVGVLGPVNVARAALPHLRETRGHLLLHTGAAHARGTAGRALESAAGAAVAGLARALAEEWAAHGVRVSCVDADTARSCAETSLDVLVSGAAGGVVTGSSGASC